MRKALCLHFAQGDELLAHCPHVLDPRSWTVTPLRATAWRGPVTTTDDPIRNATPERQRAFLNTEDWVRR